MGIIPLKNRVNRDKCNFATKQRFGSSLSMSFFATYEPRLPDCALYANLCPTKIKCKRGVWMFFSYVDTKTFALQKKTNFAQRNVHLAILGQI